MSADERRPPLPSGPFLVVGLARSGRAAARMLAKRGEGVAGVDGGRPEVGDLAELGVDVALGTDGVERLAGIRCLVKSPGVPAQAPVVQAARREGVPVIGELELAWRLAGNRFVAVTGTNGKTTVVELAGHVWREAGRAVEVAGNVGTPLSSLVGGLDGGATVICECSSFQLEDAEAFAPEAAVLLNLSPDHLDRHASLEAYREAKLRIFARQREGDLAAINADDPQLESIELPGEARRLSFGERGSGATIEQGWLVVGGERVVAADELALTGRHNAVNALAVALVAIDEGIALEAVAAALRSFPGVEHRLEPVARRHDVLYVNDSKATNVAATVAALESFDGGVRVILGGSMKGEPDFTGLVDAVAERCSACYLIGQAAEALAHDLQPAGVEFRDAGDLERAVNEASRDAVPGEVVLLAPACASFDQYEDYERRGEHFKRLVEGLTQ